MIEKNYHYYFGSFKSKICRISKQTIFLVTYRFLRRTGRNTSFMFWLYLRLHNNSPVFEHTVSFGRAHCLVREIWQKYFCLTTGSHLKQMIKPVYRFPCYFDYWAIMSWDTYDSISKHWWLAQNVGLMRQIRVAFDLNLSVIFYYTQYNVASTLASASNFGYFGVFYILP